MKDHRPLLTAIATGQSPLRKRADVLVLAEVDKHDKAFRAWAVFTDNRGREPMAAPTEILSPLP